MATFEWKKEYSVGVEMFDEQHKVFFRIVNDLYEAITTGKEKDILDEIFRQLIHYTEFHFESEEHYFDEFHYEDTVEHKKAHVELCRQIAELKEKKERQDLDNPYELLDFLENWLVDHIMGMDKKYGPCFKEHGLK